MSKNAEALKSTPPAARDPQGNFLDTEQVNVFSNATYLIYAVPHNAVVRPISIRRHDWKPCLDWRDKQAIKNQIAGPECEAAEVYPAESRVVDTSNWSHLWVLPLSERFSFGFIEGQAIRWI